MFDVNIKEKPIDNYYDVFFNMTTEMLDHVNYTQYYAPGLSFMLVLYTYFLVGYGKVWKYLLGTTFAGFMASTLTSIFDILKAYFTLDYVLQIKWFEAIFWHLNEYGFVYITFIKLKTIVQELQKKYWKYIMKVLFVYNLFIRILIALYTVMGRKTMASSHLQLYTFFPLALVEVVFMYLIILTFIKQTENKIKKDVITTMYTSSLTRMFLIGLIYFLVSIVCSFYSSPFMKSLKYVVYRAKASLGLIFLLDLLFIRIDLTNKINTQNNLQKGDLKSNDNTYLNSETRENSKYIDTTILNSISRGNSKYNDSIVHSFLSKGNSKSYDSHAHNTISRGNSRSILDNNFSYYYNNNNNNNNYVYSQLRKTTNNYPFYLNDN